MAPSPVLVIPDLHGCPLLLDWVEASFAEHRYILLGDLIHRGPASRPCLQRALAWAEAGRAVLLWGNHEWWVWADLQELSAAEQERYLQTQEASWLAQYQIAGQTWRDLLADLTEFAALAKHFHVEGEMLCAHAARPSFGRSVAELLDQGHLWDRPSMGLHPLPTEFFPEVRYSVHGHTVFSEPVVDLDGEGVVYLDLGGVDTGRWAVWDAGRRRCFLFEER